MTARAPARYECRVGVKRWLAYQGKAQHHDINRLFPFRSSKHWKANQLRTVIMKQNSRKLGQDQRDRERRVAGEDAHLHRARHAQRLHQPRQQRALGTAVALCKGSMSLSKPFSCFYTYPHLLGQQRALAQHLVCGRILDHSKFFFVFFRPVSPSRPAARPGAGRHLRKAVRNPCN